MNRQTKKMALTDIARRVSTTILGLSRQHQHSAGTHSFAKPAAQTRQTASGPKHANHPSRLFHTKNAVPSSSKRAARIGLEKLGSSNSTLRYSLDWWSLVFDFHAAPSVRRQVI
ncbi:hypothetical protein IWQ51_006655 [Labrenzia sp. EL_142]|nr:hypothetical protein [Labrenzia sp. EL_142]